LGLAQAPSSKAVASVSNTHLAVRTLIVSASSTSGLSQRVR
jgi:hypothetical protein